MDFYQVLLEIMEEKELKIPDVARLTGLADSTIRSIISRKTKNVTLEVAFKISKGLGVSLEKLNGETEKINSSKVKPVSINLTAKENILINKYRTLDNKGIHMVNTILDMEYNRCKEDQSTPLAAHDREDINVSDKDKQHDIDIMNDDNEW